MEKTIGLQIAGCAEVGFDSLLNINWPGKKLDDFMPREEFYTGPVAYFINIDSDYQTYEAVICRFEGIDLRHSALQVALRIPVGYGIADANGNEVAASAVLRPVLQKVIDENLKVFEGTYEYRGRQVPVFNTSEYVALIDRFKLMPKWGPMIDMNGSKTVYINGANDDDIDRKVRALPYIDRLSQASKVEIGDFSPAVTTTALSDEELHRRAGISVHICTRSGSVDVRSLLEGPMTLKSSEFGYNTDIYKEIAITLDRERILGSFYHGNLTDSKEGYQMQLLPSKGVVSVVFDPPLRRKGYTIELKGSDLADYQNEIFDQLLYNRQRINNHTLGFEGEQIRKFESMPNELLRDCFSLPPHSRFILENVRRDGEHIYIALKKKEQPKEAASAPNKKPSKDGTKPAESDCGRKKMLVKFDPKAKLPEKFTLEIRQSEERVVYRTTMPVEKVASASDCHQITTEFTLCRPNAAIDVRVCCPTLYKGRAQSCNGGDYDFEVNMSNRKGAVARFFSIFDWQYADGLWPVWRDVTVAAAILILCAIFYFAGVFTSGFGILRDHRDAFIDAPEVVVVDPVEPKEDKEPAMTPQTTIPEEKADTIKCDTTKVENSKIDPE